MNPMHRMSPSSCEPSALAGRKYLSARFVKYSRMKGNYNDMGMWPSDTREARSRYVVSVAKRQMTMVRIRPMRIDREVTCCGTRSVRSLSGSGPGLSEGLANLIVQCIAFATDVGSCDNMFPIPAHVKVMPMAGVRHWRPVCAAAGWNIQAKLTGEYL